MAIFNSSAFYRLRKSFGNLTTYELNGQNILREKITREDKRSPAQLAQRARMKAVITLACQLADALDRGYPAPNLSVAMNKFVSRNIGLMKIDEDCQVDYDAKQLQLSSGELLPPKVSVVIDRTSHCVTFTQGHQALRPLAPDEDRVYGVVWGRNSANTQIFPLQLRCETGTTTVQLYDHMLEFPLEVYAFTVNDKKKKASATIWLAGEDSLPG